MTTSTEALVDLPRLSAKPGSGPGRARPRHGGARTDRGAQLGHDVVIGDGCHLTPGALIAGNCQIGPGSPGGMEATVPFDGHVGEQCLVHNNAAVNTTVPDRTVGFGEGRRGELAA